MANYYLSSPSGSTLKMGNQLIFNWLSFCFIGSCTTIAQLPRISQLFGRLGLGVSVVFRIFVAQRKIRCYTLVLYLGVDSILEHSK